MLGIRTASKEMAICTPGFLGIILRKNQRTEKFIEKEISFALKHLPGATRENLNEDSYLIGFSVAMSGRDLQSTIDQLSADGAIHGVDFVATSSSEGVIDPMPKWLIEVHVSDNKQSTGSDVKWYALATGRGPENQVEA